MFGIRTFFWITHRIFLCEHPDGCAKGKAVGSQFSMMHLLKSGVWEEHDELRAYAKKMTMLICPSEVGDSYIFTPGLVDIMRVGQIGGGHMHRIASHLYQLEHIRLGQVVASLPFCTSPPKRATAFVPAKARPKWHKPRQPIGPFADRRRYMGQAPTASKLRAVNTADLQARERGLRAQIQSMATDMASIDATYAIAKKVRMVREEQEQEQEQERLADGAAAKVSGKSRKSKKTKTTATAAAAAAPQEERPPPKPKTLIGLLSRPPTHPPCCRVLVPLGGGKFEGDGELNWPGMAICTAAILVRWPVCCVFLQIRPTACRTPCTVSSWGTSLPSRSSATKTS